MMQQEVFFLTAESPVLAGLDSATGGAGPVDTGPVVTDAAEGASAGGVGGIPRFQRADRSQMEWRPLDLDSLVPADHRVRGVWTFLERMALSELYAKIRAVEGHAGRTPIDPRILLALWVYGTIEGVGSARALAMLCEHHHVYQWICGGVSVNYHTLSDFRGPGEVLADGGFVKTEAIEEVSGGPDGGTRVYAPVPLPKDKQRDRYVPLPGDSPFVAEWRVRMGTAEAKEIYKERASTAECVNAQARNRGLLRFLVRGLEKARTVALLYAISHNIVRALSFGVLPDGGT